MALKWMKPAPNPHRVPVNSSHSELVTGDEFTVAFFHFCHEFTMWLLHCDELYDWCLLYSTLAVCVPCPSAAVVCWWSTRANQFWDDFFVIILCHILRLKCIKFDFDCGSAPTPLGEPTSAAFPQTIWIKAALLLRERRERKGKEGEECREGRGEEE